MPGRPSPDVAHTQNANVNSLNVWPIYCLAIHHPTSCTLRMHTLAQSWLDIDIPTTTNPTMRRRWANVALAVNHYPTSRTIEMHMLPQCWLDIDILTMHQNSTMRGRWASVARPSITRHRPCTLKMHMLARRQNSNRDQSDDAPALGQRCPADHHSTSRTIRMHTLARHRHADYDQSDHAQTLGHATSP